MPLVKQSVFVPPPGTSTVMLVVIPPLIALAETFINPDPSPLNAPLKVTLLPLFVTTEFGNCASGIMPLANCEALRFVNPLPLPEKFDAEM